jgi:hypothetical protein
MLGGSARGGPFASGLATQRSALFREVPFTSIPSPSTPSRPRTSSVAGGISEHAVIEGEPSLFIPVLDQLGGGSADYESTGAPSGHHQCSNEPQHQQYHWRAFSRLWKASRTTSRAALTRPRGVVERALHRSSTAPNQLCPNPPAFNDAKSSSIPSHSRLQPENQCQM